jgi:ADP-ribose pyrophosphatase YjhB (NUDIX family)
MLVSRRCLKHVRRIVREFSSGKRAYPALPMLGCAVSVFSKDLKSVILIERGNPPNKGMWSLPGGLIDVGELVENAAVREVYEETGIKVRVLKDATLGASASVSPSFCQTEHIIYDDKDACEYHYILAHLVSIAESPTSDIVANDDVSDAMFVDCEKLLDGSFEKDNPKFKLTPKTKDIVELAVAVLPRYK